MARFLAQIILAGTQIVARAFARAVRQEFEASQEAARRLGNTKSRAESVANTKLGLSLEEAKQILNVTDLERKEIEERYERLFQSNDKAKGGSFYIQSKVVRAKERLDLELGSTEAQPEDSGGGSSKT